MLQLKPQNIIPITAARAQLNDIVTAAKGSNYFVISRQGRPAAAVIDWEYLSELQWKIDSEEAQEAVNGLRTGFKKYLRGQGYDPDKITDKEASKILVKMANE